MKRRAVARPRPSPTDSRASATDDPAGRRRARSRSSRGRRGREPGTSWFAAAITARRRAKRIGLKGPPGAAKSTLSPGDRDRARARGETVGGIAVEQPDEPLHGGALLGDRIRMGPVSRTTRASSSPERASRGLARRPSRARRRGQRKCSTRSGRDWVLMADVGRRPQRRFRHRAGRRTDGSASLARGGGRRPAMKAGLMDDHEVFCVTKATRDGSERLVREPRGRPRAVPKRGWSRTSSRHRRPARRGR